MEFWRFVFLIILVLALLTTKKYVVAKNGQFTLVYQLGYKFIGVVGLLMVLYMVLDIYGLVGKQSLEDWRVAVFVSLLGIPMFLEFFVRKLVFNDHFLSVRSPWSGTRIIKWSEIHGLSYSRLLDCEMIMLKNGGQVYLFEGLIGKETLIAKVQSELQEDEDDILYL